MDRLCMEAIQFYLRGYFGCVSFDRDWITWALKFMWVTLKCKKSRLDSQLRALQSFSKKMV